MNKLVFLGVILAFIIPIGAVVGLKSSGQDLENLLKGEVSWNSDTIPRGKLMYFYAPS